MNIYRKRWEDSAINFKRACEAFDVNRKEAEKQKRRNAIIGLLFSAVGLAFIAGIIGIYVAFGVIAYRLVLGGFTFG